MSLDTEYHTAFLEPQSTEHTTEMMLPPSTVDPSDARIVTYDTRSEEVPVLESWPIDRPIPDRISSRYEIDAELLMRRYDVAAQKISTTTAKAHSGHEEVLTEVGEKIEAAITRADELKTLNEQALVIEIANLKRQVAELAAQLSGIRDAATEHQNETARTSEALQQNVLRAALNMDRTMSVERHELEQHIARCAKAKQNIDDLIAESQEKAQALEVAQTELKKNRRIFRSFKDTEAKLEAKRVTAKLAEDTLRSTMALELLSKNDKKYKSGEDDFLRDLSAASKVVGSEEYESDESDKLKALMNTVTEIEEAIRTNQAVITSYGTMIDSLKLTIAELEARLYHQIPAELAVEQEKYRHEIINVRPEFDKQSTVSLTVADVFGPISEGAMELTSDIKAPYGLTAVSKNAILLKQVRSDDYDSDSLDEQLEELTFDPSATAGIPLSNGEPFKHTQAEGPRSDSADDQEASLDEAAHPDNFRTKVKLLGEAVAKVIFGPIPLDEHMIHRVHELENQQPIITQE